MGRNASSVVGRRVRDSVWGRDTGKDTERENRHLLSAHCMPCVMLSTGNPQESQSGVDSPLPQSTAPSLDGPQESPMGATRVGQEASPVPQVPVGYAGAE